MNLPHFDHAGGRMRRLGYAKPRVQVPIGKYEGA